MVPQQAKRSAPNPSPKRRKKNTGFRPLLLAAKLLAVLMMIGIITGCIVASVLTVYVLNTLDASDKVELEKMSFTTILYALDEETDEYFELQRVQNNENRVWVDYSDIPQSVKDAAVAVEDKRFWQHSGVDLKRTVMGREVVVAVTGGRLDFGTWEQIFYYEFDGKRQKHVLIKIIGE